MAIDPESQDLAHVSQFETKAWICQLRRRPFETGSSRHVLSRPTASRCHGIVAARD